MNRRMLCGVGAAIAAAGLLAAGAASASAKPILMPTLQKELKTQRAI